MYSILLTIAVLGQPVMSGPEITVPVGQLELIRIHGMTVKEWDTADVDSYPLGYDVEMDQLYGRTDGEFYPIIMFRAREGNALGRYDVVVTYTTEVDGATTHARLQYTVKTGTAPRPPTVIPPVEPSDEDTEGPIQALIFRDPLLLDADQAEACLDLRLFSDENVQDNYIVDFYSTDPVDPDGNPVPALEAYIGKIPSDADGPYLFITQKIANQNKAAILWEGVMPNTAAEVITKMKGYADAN